MIIVDLVTHMNYNNISLILSKPQIISVCYRDKTVRFLSDIGERSFDILLVYLHNEKIIAEYNVTGLNK